MRPAEHFAERPGAGEGDANGAQESGIEEPDRKHGAKVFVDTHQEDGGLCGAFDFDFDGVGQVQVKEELGYTYAAALAAFLQQDPDVIMIQELRDAEAANAAVQAAMDAALILTSLTAEDTTAALAKLSAWGVPPTLLAAAARLVISQRGIRSLCPHCKVEYTPMPDQLKRAGILNIGLKEIDGRSPAELTLFKPRGCERCAMTGYRGRLLVYELMDVTEPVREAILRGANGGEIRRIAVEAGMETVSRNALRRALEGMTSLEECMKIFPAGLRPW